MRCPACQNDVPSGFSVCDFCGSPVLLGQDAFLPGDTPRPAGRRTTVAPPLPRPGQLPPVADAPTEPPPVPRSDVARTNFGGTAPVALPRPQYDILDPLKPLRAAPTGTAVDARTPPKVRGAVIERRADDSGRVHPLKEGRNKLGRDAGCDVIVSDSRASADHGFLFIKADGGGTYHDVSRNGTLVDGRPVHGEVVTLQHGSVLQIGMVRLYILLLPPGVA